MVPPHVMSDDAGTAEHEGIESTCESGETGLFGGVRAQSPPPRSDASPSSTATSDDDGDADAVAPLFPVVSSADESDIEDEVADGLNPMAQEAPAASQVAVDREHEHEDLELIDVAMANSDEPGAPMITRVPAPQQSAFVRMVLESASTADEQRPRVALLLAIMTTIEQSMESNCSRALMMKQWEQGFYPFVRIAMLSASPADGEEFCLQIRALFSGFEVCMNKLLGPESRIAVRQPVICKDVECGALTPTPRCGRGAATTPCGVCEGPSSGYTYPCVSLASFVARVFADPILSRMVRSHQGKEAEEEHIGDVYQSRLWRTQYLEPRDAAVQRLCECGAQEGDPERKCFECQDRARHLALQLSADGISFVRRLVRCSINKKGSCTPFVATLLNLPLHMRYKKRYQMVLGITPSTVSANKLDPFLDRIALELKEASERGLEVYDVSLQRRVRVFVFLNRVIADMPALRSLTKGAGAFRQCLRCDLGGRCGAKGYPVYDKWTLLHFDPRDRQDVATVKEVFRRARAPSSRGDAPWARDWRKADFDESKREFYYGETRDCRGKNGDWRIVPFDDEELKRRIYYAELIRTKPNFPDMTMLHNKLFGFKAKSPLVKHLPYLSLQSCMNDRFHAEMNVARKWIDLFKSGAVTEPGPFDEELFAEEKAFPAKWSSRGLVTVSEDGTMTRTSTRLPWGLSAEDQVALDKVAARFPLSRHHGTMGVRFFGPASNLKGEDYLSFFSDFGLYVLAHKAKELGLYFEVFAELVHFFRRATSKVVSRSQLQSLRLQGRRVGLLMSLTLPQSMMTISLHESLAHVYEAIRDFGPFHAINTLYLERYLESLVSKSNTKKSPEVSMLRAVANQIDLRLHRSWLETEGASAAELDERCRQLAAPPEHLGDDVTLSKVTGRKLRHPQGAPEHRLSEAEVQELVRMTTAEMHRDGQEMEPPLRTDTSQRWASVSANGRALLTLSAARPAADGAEGRDAAHVGVAARVANGKWYGEATDIVELLHEPRHHVRWWVRGRWYAASTDSDREKEPEHVRRAASYVPRVNKSRVEEHSWWPLSLCDRQVLIIRPSPCLSSQLAPRVSWVVTLQSPVLEDTGEG